MRASFGSLMVGVNASATGLLSDEFVYNGFTISGFLDHREEIRDFGGIGAVQQDILVHVSRADYPTRPVKSDRITLPKYPGKTFQPNGVTLDESGDFWMFSLKAVS